MSISKRSRYPSTFDRRLRTSRATIYRSCGAIYFLNRERSSWNGGNLFADVGRQRFVARSRTIIFRNGPFDDSPRPKSPPMILLAEFRGIQRFHFNVFWEKNSSKRILERNYGGTFNRIYEHRSSRGIISGQSTLPRAASFVRNDVLRKIKEIDNVKQTL